MRRDTPPRREARETVASGAACGVAVGPAGSRYTEIAPTLDTGCKDGAIRNQIGLLVFGGGNTSGAIGAAASLLRHGVHQDFETETFVVQETQSGVWVHATAGTVRSDAPGSQPGGSLVRNRHAVRRLTPRECERLQGFPDHYTLIPYRNKYAADGPRYRAIGNSMAVPVVRWIGRRIEDACRRTEEVL
jgi:DNA (cytosine-5)-methyltransferase 1